LEQDLTRADLPPRTMAAIAFGRSQSRSGPAGAPAAREALLRAGFGADEMKEIAYNVAVMDFLNRSHTILATPAPPMERMPDQLQGRLLRPLINRIMKGHRFRGQAAPLDRVPDYPYARLVRAFPGSPIAPTLGRTLEEMWASPHLTRRCKLLMLAVVARGLGCEGGGQEVGAALRAGGLPPGAPAQSPTPPGPPARPPPERPLRPL